MRALAGVIYAAHGPTGGGPQLVALLPRELGGVDKIRLQRVVDVMQQYLGFDSSFNIGSMLTG